MKVECLHSQCSRRPEDPAEDIVHIHVLLLQPQGQCLLVDDAGHPGNIGKNYFILLLFLFFNIILFYKANAPITR